MTYGKDFRERITKPELLQLIGVYDAFSGRLAEKYFEGVFLSGFGYVASAHALQDIGFLSWSDLLAFARSLRSAIRDETYLLVDVDDGFGNESVAATVIPMLERLGVGAVMIEDQKRPRKCGHFEGKTLLPIDEYLVKLKAVLKSRKDLFVIARTDATDIEEGIRRARIYEEAEADAVMVEAVNSLDEIKQLTSSVSVPVMVNQLGGGKSPSFTVEELEKAGVSLVIYSTPCLFAAQKGIENYLTDMVKQGRLPEEGAATLADFMAVLDQD